MRWRVAGLILLLALYGCAAPTVSTPSRSLSTLPSAFASTVTPVPTLRATQLPVTLTPSITVTPASVAMDCPEGQTQCIVPGYFFFRRPLDPSANNTIDQTYRYGTTQGDKREPHHGVDFANAQGTPVLAVGDGEVIVAGDDKLTRYGWFTNFYGNLVVIAHRLPGFAETVYTLYGHLYRVNVTVGKQVKAGDQIGEVGATGIAIGSHLHLELRIATNDYQSTRNPELWLLPPVGMGVLAGHVVDAQGQAVESTIHIQRIQDSVILPDPIYQAETYTRAPLTSDDILRENFAVGELPAGEYRLTLIYYGKVYEERVKIEPGKLTIVVFRL